MCGPRQLFFFQFGPEMPKGWTPLQGETILLHGGGHSSLTFQGLQHPHQHSPSDRRGAEAKQCLQGHAEELSLKLICSDSTCDILIHLRQLTSKELREFSFTLCYALNRY